MLLINPEGIIASGPPAQVLADRAAWQKLGLLIPEWIDAMKNSLSAQAGRNYGWSKILRCDGWTRVRNYGWGCALR